MRQRDAHRGLNQRDYPRTRLGCQIHMTATGTKVISVAVRAETTFEFKDSVRWELISILQLLLLWHESPKRSIVTLNSGRTLVYYWTPILWHRNCGMHLPEISGNKLVEPSVSDCALLDLQSFQFNLMLNFVTKFLQNTLACLDARCATIFHNRSAMDIENAQCRIGFPA